MKDGTIRTNTYEDTEAKLFEYLATLYEKEPFKREICCPKEVCATVVKALWNSL